MDGQRNKPFYDQIFDKKKDTYLEFEAQMYLNDTNCSPQSRKHTFKQVSPLDALLKCGSLSGIYYFLIACTAFYLSRDIWEKEAIVI